MALERTVRVESAPGALREAAEGFMADCKARNLSPCTISLNRIVLKSLTDFLEPVLSQVETPVRGAVSEVGSNDLRRFFIDKASATSPATAARYYDCIKRFFAFLEEEGFVRANPMAAVQKPKAPVPVIQPLAQDQVEAMLTTCGNGFTGLRNRLALLILVDTGVRASELCGLTLADVDMDDQRFLVRHGKGERSRRVPFGSAVLGALRQYLARRAEVTTPNLVVNVYGDAIDRYRVRAIVKDAAQRAGVEHPHMGPHLLRHTCAVQYLRSGGDVFSLQKVLGHATLVMTRRYSELTDTDVADKHRLYSPADSLSAAATASGRRTRLR